MTQQNPTRPQSPQRIQAQRIRDLELKLEKAQKSRWRGVSKKIKNLRQKHPQAFGLCLAVGWAAVALTLLATFPSWWLGTALMVSTALMGYGLVRMQIKRTIKLDLYQLVLSSVVALLIVCGALWIAPGADSETGDDGSVVSRLASGGFQPLELTVSSANVREGPGMEHAAFATVQNGEKVRVVETRDFWVLLEDKSGEQGWVSRSLIANQID